MLNDKSVVPSTVKLAPGRLLKVNWNPPLPEKAAPVRTGAFVAMIGPTDARLYASVWSLNVKRYVPLEIMFAGMFAPKLCATPDKGKFVWVCVLSPQLADQLPLATNL